jgi:hypothetical protein
MHTIIDGDGRYCRAGDILPEPARYLPTPEAIADGCQAIQATWSGRERQRRHNPATAWTVPEVHYEGAD